MAWQTLLFAGCVFKEPVWIPDEKNFHRRRLYLPQPGRHTGYQRLYLLQRRGSGEFAVSPASIAAIGTDAEPFIAYLQAYTCTYAPVSRLEPLYREILEHPRTSGLSIATRPDCLPMETLSLLSRLQKDYPDKFLWIELGLQTIHEKTASYIRRGYSLPCFARTAAALQERSIPVIAHDPGSARGG